MLTNQSVSAGNAKVSVAVVATDGERRRAIVKTICGTQARIIREFSEFPIGNTLSKLVESDCDVIVVDLDGGVGASVDLIGEICSRNALVTVMACSSRHEADVVIRSMRAGAREFLTEPMAAATIAEAFARASARRQYRRVETNRREVARVSRAPRAAPESRRWRSISPSLSPKKRGQVVLVDMHPQLGEVALGLGIAPRFRSPTLSKIRAVSMPISSRRC